MSGINIEKIIAGRWIAGPDIDDAIERSTKLNAINIKTMINYLGEEFRSKDLVNESLDIYQKVISLINQKALDATISIKPTQIGLSINQSLFKKNYTLIVRSANKYGIFVWLDMEESRYIDKTIATYLSVSTKYKNTGICIQAYMKRSNADIKRVVLHSGIIRLVKGAYHQSGFDVYHSREEITQSYCTIMDYLFKHSEKFMIATHDESIISKALKLNSNYNKDIEFGMLNGIMNDKAKKLARNGKKVSMYVPFGKRWKEYAYRRLKEANNLKLIMRSVLSR